MAKGGDQFPLSQQSDETKMRELCHLLPPIYFHPRAKDRRRIEGHNKVRLFDWHITKKPARAQGSQTPKGTIQNRDLALVEPKIGCT